jgi:pyruvate/2-oxoglutarate dehydrogenase complex dihydrolipoamide dehydrogenase (E3) component
MSRRSARRSSASRRLVERQHLGGICLNWGCIPTKALLRSAEIFHYLYHAKDYGLKVDGKIAFDPAAVVKRSRAFSAQLNNGVGFLLKKNKVDVIWGEARIAKPGEVLVSTSKKPAMQPPWPRTSLSRPARDRASYRASSLTENLSGPTSRPWFPENFPNPSS